MRHRSTRTGIRRNETATHGTPRTAAYPVSIVLKGQKAMPFFAMQLDDQQVADVVNYLRSHFGNRYRDKVKPEDVKMLR